MAQKRKTRKAVIKAPKKLRQAIMDALGDVHGGKPVDVTIEFAPPRIGFDDDQPWSGNIYRYSF